MSENARDAFIDSTTDTDDVVSRAIWDTAEKAIGDDDIEALNELAARIWSRPTDLEESAIAAGFNNGEIWGDRPIHDIPKMKSVGDITFHTVSRFGQEGVAVESTHKNAKLAMRNETRLNRLNPGLGHFFPCSRTCEWQIPQTVEFGVWAVFRNRHRIYTILIAFGCRSADLYRWSIRNKHRRKTNETHIPHGIQRSRIDLR